MLDCRLYSNSHMEHLTSRALLLNAVYLLRKTAISSAVLLGNSGREMIASGCKGRIKRRKKRKRRQGRVTIITISLLAPLFFLRRGYSECQLCSAAAVQWTLLQRSHPHCTPSTPLNCQLWQSILSLVLSLLASGHSSWLQEDKRSSTESVPRSAAPSCPAAAPLFRALLPRVREASFTVESPPPYFLFHFFLPKFSTVHTHIRP